MNFKKFISGISALTIAASAFAGMAVTASAFDTVTIDYEGTDPVVDWTSSSTGRYTVDMKETSGNHYITVNAVGTGNNGTTVSTNSSYAATVAAGTDFTMSFDMQLNGGTNQASTFYVKAPTGNILKLALKAANGTEWIINDDSTATVTLAKSTWYSFKITRLEADDASDDITYLTIKDANGTDVFAQKIISSALSANGGVSGMSFETKRYYSYLAMDNVVVRDVDTANDVPQTVSYKVTTNCVAQDDTATVLKTSSAYVESGEEYTPSYDTSFDDDNYRYTYVSGAETKSITEDTTFTLVYSKEALAEHTVTIKTTGYESVLDSVTVKDKKSGSYAYPRYILSGTDLYQITKDRYDQGYVKSFNNVTDDLDVTEAYSAEVEDVIYYAEAEDIATLTTASTNNNIPIRCSSGNAAYAAEDAVITNLPAGKYKIALATFGNAGTTFTATIGSNEAKFTTLGYFAETLSEEFTITEATDVVIGKMGNGGSSPKVIDYIYIVKTGDVEKQDDMAFTFNKSISELAGKAIVVHRSADDKTATISELIDDNGTVYSGEGDIKLAIIFTNIPEAWGTLSLTLE